MEAEIMSDNETPDPVLPTKQPSSRSNSKRVQAMKARRANPPKETVTEEQAEEQRIEYRQDRVLDHHLWKLNATEMIRNAGYENNPMLQDVMHQHFFHNITSNGEPKSVCSPVGGHYHDVEIIPATKPGMAPRIKVGPAYQLLGKKVGNSMKTYKAPLKFIDAENEEIIDDHTHKATYQGSQKVNVRTVNVEAVKVQSNAESQGKPMPGVVG